MKVGDIRVWKDKGYVFKIDAIKKDLVSIRYFSEQFNRYGDITFTWNRKTIEESSVPDSITRFNDLIDEYYNL